LPQRGPSWAGFLREILRWWDHWLKGEANGVMDEPMLRAWISENVTPAADDLELPGRWVAEDRWPPGPRFQGIGAILWFDLGEAILPSRPQLNCAAVSSGGQGCRHLAAPVGLVLDGREHGGRLGQSGRRRSQQH
jgi:hypothetical protein